MEHLIEQLIGYGLPVVTLVITLESIGAPLPGESLMIALGSALGARHEALGPAFLALWLGSVLGDNLGYAIGRRLGREAVLRHGARLGLTEARMQHFSGVFARYGVLVVVVARFFVLLRQLNGVLAGTLGLPWWRFLAANLVGGALWVGLWLSLSDRLSARAMALIHQLPPIKLAAVLALLVLAIAAVATFLARRRG